MDFASVMGSVVGGIHVLAAIIWLGGLVFLVGTLFPFRSVDTTGLRSVFNTAIVQFRPYLYISMGVSVLTGVYRIFQAGGMGGVSPIIHIKIALVIVMIVLCLVSYLHFLPKVEEAIRISQQARRATDTPGEVTPKTAKITTAADAAIRGIVWNLGVAGVLGVAIILALAFAGRFTTIHSF